MLLRKHVRLTCVFNKLMMMVMVMMMMMMNWELGRGNETTLMLILQNSLLPYISLSLSLSLFLSLFLGCCINNGMDAAVNSLRS